MWALRFDEQVKLDEIEPPRVDAGKAIVRVTTAGICNTDLELVRGYMGFAGTLGHEFVGVVEESADARWIGKRVCGDINVACGECATCKRGDPHHCPARSVIGIVAHDGAFAERVSVPLANLFAVPDRVDDDAAVFTEPLAAAFEILEQVSLKPSDRVAVLGDGKLGLLCGMALLSAGCDVTQIGKHDRKLAIAERAGARTKRAQAALDERFDLVVEATGSDVGLAQALTCVRPRGRVILKSTFAGAPTVDTNRIVIDEIQLLGSRCGPFDRALSALAAGTIDPRPLIDDRFPLREGVAAMERAAQRGTLKILLDVS